MKETFKRNLYIGFGLSLLILIISTVASYVSIHSLLESSKMVNNTNLILREMENYISILKDAETGQRGYLLTGENEFLEPYHNANKEIGHSLEKLRQLSKNDPSYQLYWQQLDTLKSQRIRQLDKLIFFRRANKDAKANVEEIRNGKVVMDEIRRLVSIVQRRAEDALTERTARLNTFSNYTPVLIIVAAVLAITITLIFYIRVKKDFEERSRMQKELQRKDISINRRLNIIQNIADKISAGNYKIRLNEEGKDTLGNLADSMNKMAESLQYSFDLLSDKEWLQKGVVELNEKMMGETDLQKLTAGIIEFVSHYTESQVGALYIQENERLKLYSGHAFVDDGSRQVVNMGEGLVGQCAVSGKRTIINEIDPGNMLISFASGELNPNNLVVFPFFHHKKVKGVIELASLHEFSARHLAFMETVSNNVGIVINSTQNRQKLQELLEETQAQSEELHTQHSELQSLNAELEGQTEKLQSSEEELRVQQEELLQTNQELEERTRLLEDKNQLILERNIEIQTKAEQLELSTRYKSEFLANMSHELRTPLNSILLLSGLMASNEKKNLSEEYIEYAQIIQSSGNGLLALIDEILDLSKIEAGKMDLYYEDISLAGMVTTLKGLFSPVAKDKNIELIFDLSPDVPESIQTDKLRLEQVIRNLMANALKFTPTGGKVTVHIFKPAIDDKKIAISVKDTGIGIAKEKHQVIFEAFQQEDGSTRRKFGGTGLGLSISRDLVKLLKGEIRLFSEPGQGSEFTLYIPVEKPVHSLSDIQTPRDLTNHRDKLPGHIDVSKTPVHYVAPVQNDIADDRNELSHRDKVVLIIEDDKVFAKILLDFTRKNGFKGIVALRGDEGIEFARKYKPIGIVLDIELPVKNGWEVMEILKNDPATRHIPVHMISAHVLKDERVLNGTFDFTNKPVELDKIREIFHKFDQAPSRHPKKVLIIEENSIHSKALAYFLENSEFKTEIKNNLEDCIVSLQKKEVECVILDMDSLDLQNFDKLGDIKKIPGLENLPIIVFTTRNLSKAEEFRLKQYVDSIVVKTAHSYQRILDEVTLFLHTVDEQNQPDKKSGKYKKTGALKEVLENRTVLITDDDVRNIFSLTKALEAFNMNVVSAMDGKEALQQLKENRRVDIILMDMMMPEMDGYETIMHIRKNPAWKNIPVISVTAKAMTGDREKCIVAGASDYISKPVDIDQLLSLLRVWLYDKQFNRN